MKGGATFSRDGKRRYKLWRSWGAGPRVMWIGLNPSTAGKPPDEDQTTRKIRGFSERLGYGTFILMNLFDWISTDPKKLYGWPPEGLYMPDNFYRIVASSYGCKEIICAWGRHGTLNKQGDRVVEFLYARGLGRKLRCLGHNADGTYPHPLMLPYSSKLRRI